MNGAIGELQSVEYYSTTYNNRESMPLWLKFDTEYLFRHVRLNYTSQVQSRPNLLNQQWVPIECRSSNIDSPNVSNIDIPILTGALSKHKSQDSTFIQIVFQNHKNYEQHLLYVAVY